MHYRDKNEPNMLSRKSKEMDLVAIHAADEYTVMA